MTPICKKSEFMLCQVCLQGDKLTTLKMLVFWMEFGSIRAWKYCLWVFSVIMYLSQLKHWDLPLISFSKHISKDKYALYHWSCEYHLFSLSGCFHTCLVWSERSEFSVWSNQNYRCETSPAWTKQPNLGPMKRGGLFLVWKHFSDGSNFEINYRKFWQAVVRTGKKKNSATKENEPREHERRGGD